MYFDNCKQSFSNFNFLDASKKEPREYCLPTVPSKTHQSQSVERLTSSIEKRESFQTSQKQNQIETKDCYKNFEEFSTRTNKLNLPKQWSIMIGPETKYRVMKIH